MSVREPNARRTEAVIIDSIEQAAGHLDKAHGELRELAKSPLSLGTQQGRNIHVTLTGLHALLSAVADATTILTYTED